MKLRQGGCPRRPFCWQHMGWRHLQASVAMQRGTNACQHGHKVVILVVKAKPFTPAGPKVLAIKQSSPAQADILPARGLVQNLSAASGLRELRLCALHLLHPRALRSAFGSLRLLRMLVLDYVEAYEKVTQVCSACASHVPDPYPKKAI